MFVFIKEVSLSIVKQAPLARLKVMNVDDTLLYQTEKGFIGM